MNITGQLRSLAPPSEAIGSLVPAEPPANTPAHVPARPAPQPDSTAQTARSNGPAPEMLAATKLAVTLLFRRPNTWEAIAGYIRVCGSDGGLDGVLLMACHCERWRKPSGPF